MATMSSVTVVHEKVHQGAQENQKPWKVWQRTGYVGLMLGPEKISRNAEEPDKDQATSRKQSAQHALGVSFSHLSLLQQKARYCTN
tara:strand:- start:922 stop:1179 length:258 start_codon:yes stop_codon:yes gene_type:complete